MKEDLAVVAGGAVAVLLIVAAAVKYDWIQVVIAAFGG
jgi:hypothetical protein